MFFPTFNIKKYVKYTYSFDLNSEHQAYFSLTWSRRVMSVTRDVEVPFLTLVRWGAVDSLAQVSGLRWQNLLAPTSQVLKSENTVALGVCIWCFRKTIFTEKDTQQLCFSLLGVKYSCTRDVHAKNGVGTSQCQWGEGPSPSGPVPETPGGNRPLRAALLCFLLLADQCADRLSLHVHCPGCSMKRASSLNVLNVGGKAAEDHFQVRSPAPLMPSTAWARPGGLHPCHFSGVLPTLACFCFSDDRHHSDTSYAALTWLNCGDSHALNDLSVFIDELYSLPWLKTKCSDQVSTLGQFWFVLLICTILAFNKCMTNLLASQAVVQCSQAIQNFADTRHWRVVTGTLQPWSCCQLCESRVDRSP